MKTFLACFTAMVVLAASTANADLYDVPGLPVDFQDNETIGLEFDFPPNEFGGSIFSIKSIEVDVNHTWSGDVDIRVIAPDAQEFVLMDNAGGSTDLGGVYTFVESGGAAAGTYAAGGPGLYDAFSWGSGPWSKNGWVLQWSDTAGGDTGSINRVTIDFNKIPEPTSAIALLGLAGLAIVRRRRRR